MLACTLLQITINTHFVTLAQYMNNLVQTEDAPPPFLFGRAWVGEWNGVTIEQWFSTGAVRIDLTVVTSAQRNCPACLLFQKACWS